jgi:hypothetical protein
MAKLENGQARGMHSGRYVITDGARPKRLAGPELHDWAGIDLGVSLMPFSPILNRLPDRLRRKIAAAHFVFRYASQRVSHVLLLELIRLFHRFAQHHLSGHRRAGNGYGASHALELDVLNDIIFYAQRDEDGVAVDGASHNRFAGRVVYAPNVAWIGIVLANLRAVQRETPFG